MTLLRRYSEVCEVTKGREALEKLVEQTHKVASNIPDYELSRVVAALLAAGRDLEVTQLMVLFALFFVVGLPLLSIFPLSLPHFVFAAVPENIKNTFNVNDVT